MAQSKENESAKDADGRALKMALKVGVMGGARNGLSAEHALSFSAAVSSLVAVS